MSGMRNSVMVAVAVLTGACGGVASLPHASPRASQVEVGKGDPPPGSTNLGAIEAEHGHGCGLYGQAGTLEGAMVELRNEAAARNANYVAILTTTAPHSEHGCFDQRFVIRGIAYRISAPVPAAGQAPGGALGTGGCDPPCSPGYRCAQAVCLAVCNPTCSADQICRQDRTCGPAEPQPAASKPLMGPPASEEPASKPVGSPAAAPTGEARAAPGS